MTNTDNLGKWSGLPPLPTSYSFDGYEIHIHEFRCACSHVWTHSEVFELWTDDILTPKTGFRELRATNSDHLWDKPIFTKAIPFHSTLICYACAASAHVTVPLPYHITAEQWNATKEKKRAEVAARRAEQLRARSRTKPQGKKIDIFAGFEDE